MAGRSSFAAMKDLVVYIQGRYSLIIVVDIAAGDLRRYEALVSKFAVFPRTKGVWGISANVVDIARKVRLERKDDPIAILMFNSDTTARPEYTNKIELLQLLHEPDMYDFSELL
jgi:hypothetical protein